MTSRAPSGRWVERREANPPLSPPIGPTTPEGPRAALLDCYDRREQGIDVRMLMRRPDVDICAPHQHTRASHPRLGIIQQFQIVPKVDFIRIGL